MKRIFVITLVALIILPTLSFAQGDRFVLLASTIGPIDAGIVEVFENAFEKDTGIRVRHVGAGTGATLKIASKGNVDLVMVHAKSLEEKFVKDGFGTERIPLMYNDYVIVGPANDPAGIKGMKDAPAALKKIATTKNKFLSRGDKSGTNVAEMEIWEKAGIKPEGSWYIIYDKGSAGNAATLQHADKEGIYTFVDRATYISLKKDVKLVILTEGDQALYNFISLIPINQKKFPRANNKDAMIFVKWLTAPNKGQTIIKDFGKDKYGTPLFFPDSQEWKKLNVLQ